MPGPRRSDRKRSAPSSYTDTTSRRSSGSTKKRSSSSKGSSKSSSSKKKSTSSSSSGSKKGGSRKRQRTTSSDNEPINQATGVSTDTAGNPTKEGNVGTTATRGKKLKAPKGGSKAHPMNDDQAKAGAKEDKKSGKAPSTQAGHYVHEEMERMKHHQPGVHHPKNRAQAIAIGLSKARKAGIPVGKKK